MRESIKEWLEDIAFGVFGAAVFGGFVALIVYCVFVFST